MKRRLAALAAITFLLLTAAPVMAAGRPSAIGRYWRDFKDYWANAFENQGAVVMVTLSAGALAMFIITRGKWKK
jgi:hypothetical protein